MALIRDIQALHPNVSQKLIPALAELDKLGVKYFINETLRTRETQICYFLQGRVSLEVVNQIRRETCSMWPITEAENKLTVTKTLKSKHIDGMAVDIVPVRGTEPWWNAPLDQYKKIADVMKSHGFKWGGDWNGFPDLPHYEM